MRQIRALRKSESSVNAFLEQTTCPTRQEEACRAQKVLVPYFATKKQGRPLGQLGGSRTLS